MHSNRAVVRFDTNEILRPEFDSLEFDGNWEPMIRRMVLHKLQTWTEAIFKCTCYETGLIDPLELEDYLDLCTLRGI